MTKSPPAFVTPAQPGWSVVVFLRDEQGLPDPEDEIQLVPVIAWATWPDTQTSPITADGSADLEHDWCAPDGTVRCESDVFESPQAYVKHLRGSEQTLRRIAARRSATRTNTSDEESLA